MTNDALDPLIHVPARLRIVVTLANLPDGDELSFPRLQDILGLTPGNLITHLRKLEEAGYVATEKTGHGNLVEDHGGADQPGPRGARRLHGDAARPPRRALARSTRDS